MVASWAPDVSSLQHHPDGKVVGDHGHNSDLWLAVTILAVARIEARVCSGARNYSQKISAQMSVSLPLFCSLIFRVSRSIRVSFVFLSRFARDFSVSDGNIPLPRAHSFRFYLRPLSPLFPIPPLERLPQYLYFGSSCIGG